MQSMSTTNGTEDKDPPLPQPSETPSSSSQSSDRPKTIDAMLEEVRGIIRDGFTKEDDEIKDGYISKIQSRLDQLRSIIPILDNDAHICRFFQVFIHNYHRRQSRSPDQRIKHTLDEFIFQLKSEYLIRKTQAEKDAKYREEKEKVKANGDTPGASSEAIEQRKKEVRQIEAQRQLIDKLSRRLAKLRKMELTDDIYEDVVRETDRVSKKLRTENAKLDKLLGIASMTQSTLFKPIVFKNCTGCDEADKEISKFISKYLKANKMQMPHLQSIHDALENIAANLSGKKFVVNDTVACRVKDQMVKELSRRRAKNLQGDYTIYISDESDDEPDDKDPELLKSLQENEPLKKSELTVLEEFYEKQKKGDEEGRTIDEDDSDSESVDLSKFDEDRLDELEAEAEEEKEEDAGEEYGEEDGEEEDGEEEADMQDVEKVKRGEGEEEPMEFEEPAAEENMSPAADPNPVEPVASDADSRVQKENTKDHPSTEKKDASSEEPLPSKGENVTEKVNPSAQTSANEATKVSEKNESCTKEADTSLSGESGLGKGEEAEIIPVQRGENDVGTQPGSVEAKEDGKRKMSSSEKSPKSKKAKADESPRILPRSNSPTVICLDDDESDKEEKSPPTISDKQIEIIDLSDDD